MNMTRLRALCPITCTCIVPGFFSSAGFFGTPRHGCSSGCISVHEPFDDLAFHFQCEDWDFAGAATEGQDMTYFGSFREAYVNYVQGLLEYTQGETGMLDRIVSYNIGAAAYLDVIQQTEATQAMHHVVTGGFVRSLI